MDQERKDLATDLEALRTALEVVRDVAVSTKAEVAIPYMIGCGHNGGDWGKISEVIGGEAFRYRKKRRKPKTMSILRS